MAAPQLSLSPLNKQYKKLQPEYVLLPQLFLVQSHVPIPETEEVKDSPTCCHASASGRNVRGGWTEKSCRENVGSSHSCFLICPHRMFMRHFNLAAVSPTLQHPCKELAAPLVRSTAVVTEQENLNLISRESHVKRRD